MLILLNSLATVIFSIAFVLLVFRLVLGLLDYWIYLNRVQRTSELHKIKNFRILFVSRSETYVVQALVGFSWKDAKEIPGLQNYYSEFSELHKAEEILELFLEEVRKVKRKNIVIGKYKV